ncbi:MAG TPA: glycosyltransferase [Usitatibacter sp.]|nr:glycosyltransferase [Usitatibacter sp.]
MISFVIPAYNEERCIGACVGAIHAAMKEAGGEYEVVVADDASSDATAAIARAAGARVVRVENRQISKTRNAGAREARGERLVFVDADTRVNAGVIRATVGALDAGAVGGGAMPEFEEGAPRYATRMLTRIAAFMRWMHYAAGCYVFCRREDFEAIGGFDERHFAAEEIVLSRALKRRGRMEIVRETVLTSARKFANRSYGETVWLHVKLLAQGMRGVRRRDATQFWYDGKR